MDLNATERKEINDENKRQRERELQDLIWIGSTPQGRRFLWRVLSLAGVFQTSFTGNSQTFFNEGRRDIGLWLLGEIDAAKPEMFTQARADFLSEQGIKKAKANKKGKE